MGYYLDTENYRKFNQYISNIISELCKVEFRNKKIVNATSIFELINNEIIANLQKIQNLQLDTRVGKGWWIDSKDNFVIEGAYFHNLEYSSSLTKNIDKCLHNKIIDVKDLDALFNDNKYRYTIHDDVDEFNVTFEIDEEVILKTSISGKIYWDVGSEEKNVILRSWVVRIELPEIIRLSDKFFSISLEKIQDKKIFVPDDDDDEYEYEAGDIIDKAEDEELKRKKERLMLGFIDDKDVELSNKQKMKKERIEELDEQELDETI